MMTLTAKIFLYTSLAIGITAIAACICKRLTKRFLGSEEDLSKVRPWHKGMPNEGSND